MEHVLSTSPAPAHCLFEPPGSKPYAAEHPLLYRDQLVSADERNEAGAGLRYQRVVSARSELAWSAQLRWLGYHNPSLPWAGRPGGSSIGAPVGRRQGSGAGPGLRLERRDDLLAGLAMGSTFFLSPDFDATISAHYDRLSSPVEVEAYRQAGAGLSARLAPAPDWRIELALDWRRREYDHAPRHLERNDQRVSLGASLRHFVADTEIYLAAAYTDNDCTLEQWSFRQMVAECGIAWSF